jgi:hypothetical protein
MRGVDDQVENRLIEFIELTRDQRQRAVDRVSRSAMYFHSWRATVIVLPMARFKSTGVFSFDGSAE